MKIALIGFGKMGKMIDQLSTEQGHEVVLKISSSNTEDLKEDKLNGIDIAIEFSGPENAPDNILKLLRWGVPVVSGSTGWLERMDEILETIEDHDGAFFYASNFSISVNVFFEINKKLASLMSKFEQQPITIVEVHHTEKKDAPSGTAISLAEQIIENNPFFSSWESGRNLSEDSINIISERVDGVTGTHVVTYNSEMDQIIMSHISHKREAFASGALKAAEFLLGKQGFFQMSDMLKL